MTMENSKRLEYTENYFSTLYDYCLDIVTKFLKYDSWYSDFDREVYAFDYSFKKVDSKYYVYFDDESKRIALPVNELNDYFKLQNIMYVFNKVLRDLNINRRVNSNNNFSLIVKKKYLPTLVNNMDYVQQSTKHARKTNCKEDYIYNTLDLILNSTWINKGNGSYINYLFDYDENNYELLIKLDNKNIDNKKLLYTKISMNKETYYEFINRLKEKLNMFGIEFYDYNKLFTIDLNNARGLFKEYYSEGIKIKKLKY